MYKKRKTCSPALLKTVTLSTPFPAETENTATMANIKSTKHMTEFTSQFEIIC